MSALSKLTRTVLLVLVALPPSAGLAQQSASLERVLVLHWYDRGYTDDIKLDQELHAALESSAPGRVEYYSEYLDTNQFPGENQALILRDYLRRKYAGVAIDVVIAITNPPLDFLLKNRRELFPHTPIVFSIGAAARAPGMPEAGATGIVTANTFRETVDLALKLHPGTKQLFVISGTLSHDKSRESAARTELQVFKDKVVITYLTDLSVEELIRKLKDSPKNSIALYVWQQVLNREGNVLESNDVLSRIAHEVVVPLYGMSPSYVGGGMTGGYVWTLEANVTKLAQIAQRVVNGERPEDIPIENAPETPMFDWRQLQRWGIREDRLPPGSVIRFRELTVWQQYKWRIVGTIAVVVLQTVLICALLIQRKRAQRRATALVEAQRVIQESEERFRRVFEEGPLGLGLVGKNYYFVKVNSALCQMVGYSEAELLQRSFIDITHPDDVRADVELAARLFRSEIPSYQIRKRYVKKNGEIIWINLTASLIRDKEGQPIHGLAMVEDITEVKRSQEEALARQKLESVGVLASGIAHDFNNLLGGILASSELALSELAEDSAAEEELQMIKTASIRGAEIVRELMIYGGNESPVLEPVDISALVSEMLQLLKVSISKQTTLKIELGQGFPLIKASPAQIRQVVMNLVTNASEAIGERSGTIHITSAKLKVNPGSPAPSGTTLPEGEYVRLEVSDTGSGMTPEVQARIFDPFFTTKHAGRGLGLAAVQGIIHGHGGTIHVESASGQGSHFEILLPCIGQSARETSDVAVTPSANQLGTVAGTVLVVEDEEMLRLAVSKMLRRLGFSVIEAGDGTTGVNLFRAHESKIDMVLLDMTLPGMAVREVLKELLKIRPSVKVILTTAFGEDRALSSIGEQRVWGYVRKPYQFRELTRLLLKASLDEPKVSGNAAG
jgi:PAS domain S-box-containing protein